MQFSPSSALSHWATYRHDSIALDKGETSLTYGVLEDAVARVATGLNHTVRDAQRQRVAIASLDPTLGLIGTLGIARAGHSAVILNPELPVDSIAANLRDTGCNYALTDESTASVANVASELGVLCGRTDVLKSSEKEQQFAGLGESSPSDEWGVFFSSGTTGIPKGIERDHESVVTELIGWVIELHLGRETTFHVGRPVFYTGGLVLTLSVLLAGGRVVLDQPPAPSDFDAGWVVFEAVCNRHDLDWAFLIPSQVRRFLALADDRPLMRRPRTLLIMGEPIAAAEKQSVVGVLADNVVESWGNTESLGTITERRDIHDRPESVGRPFVTDFMTIVDDNGAPVPDGQFGRIAGAQEAGFGRYSSRPKETDRVKRQGLIISDDIGFRDSEGYFYVQGRFQETIVTPAGTVFISELEARLRRVLPNHTCYLCTPDRTGVTPEVILCVEGDPQPDQRETFVDRVNAALPEELSCIGCSFINRIPTLPSGKVDRMELQKEADSAGYSQGEEA